MISAPLKNIILSDRIDRCSWHFTRVIPFVMCSIGLCIMTWNWGRPIHGSRAISCLLTADPVFVHEQKIRQPKCRLWSADNLITCSEWHAVSCAHSRSTALLSLIASEVVLPEPVQMQRSVCLSVVWSLFSLPFAFPSPPFPGPSPSIPLCHVNHLRLL